MKWEQVVTPSSDQFNSSRKMVMVSRRMRQEDSCGQWRHRRRWQREVKGDERALRGQERCAVLALIWGELLTSGS